MNYDVDMPPAEGEPPRIPHNVHQTDVKRASGGPNPKRPAESYFTARYLLNFITCPATFVRCVPTCLVASPKRAGETRKWVHLHRLLFFFYFSE